MFLLWSMVMRWKGTLFLGPSSYRPPRTRSNYDNNSRFCHHSVNIVWICGILLHEESCALWRVVGAGVIPSCQLVQLWSPASLVEWIPSENSRRDSYFNIKRIQLLQLGSSHLPPLRVDQIRCLMLDSFGIFIGLDHVTECLRGKVTELTIWYSAISVLWMPPCFGLPSHVSCRHPWRISVQ